MIFSGCDLLRLSRDDLIQICGLADGIRLNNALQSKTMRPKLTIYLCQARTQPYRDPLSSPGTSPTPVSHILTHPSKRTPSVPINMEGRSRSSDVTTAGASGKMAAQSSKRQYRESNDYDYEEEEVFTKKQRTRHLHLGKKGGSAPETSQQTPPLKLVPYSPSQALPVKLSITVISLANARVKT